MRSTAKEHMVKTKIVLRLQETNKQYYTEHKEYNLIWRGTTAVMYSDAFFEDLITHIDTKAIDLCNENKYLQLEIGKCLQNKNSRKAMMNLNETYAINDHVKAQALKCVQYQTSLPSDHCSPTTPTKCTFGLTYSKLSLLHESAWNFPMLTSTPLYNAWSSTLVDNKVVLFTIMFT